MSKKRCCFPIRSYISFSWRQDPVTALFDLDGSKYLVVSRDVENATYRDVLRVQENAIAFISRVEPIGSQCEGGPSDYIPFFRAWVRVMQPFQVSLSFVTKNKSPTRAVPCLSSGN